MNSEKKNFFPTGIVTGVAFCDREEERGYLKQQMEQNAHVVLISPRRYGKSSLVAQFTLEQKLPFASIDLLPATSGKYVKNAIMDGVTHLLNSMIPRFKKLKDKLMTCFSGMNPVIELSAFGQSIRLTSNERTHEETIIKLLMNLDKMAQQLDQQLIFSIDEFQQVATLEESHTLEASIRHAVERSKNVFYIFSGSNRSLLEELFSKRNRPLYHLCDEMKLGRIDKDYYVSFIKKAVKYTWQKSIPDTCINKILDLTECHPYYVNKLCRMLWRKKIIPDLDCVEETWKKYIEVQKTDWALEMIGQLTVNQRKVLAGIAALTSEEIAGKNFYNKLEISASSLQRSLITLMKKDIIYKVDKHYRILNPVISAILGENKYFDLA